MLVFFTTIVFGALMPFFITFFKSLDKEDPNTNYIQLHDVEERISTGVKFDYLHPNFSPE